LKRGFVTTRRAGRLYHRARNGEERLFLLLEELFSRSAPGADPCRINLLKRGVLLHPMGFIPDHLVIHIPALDTDPFCHGEMWALPVLISSGQWLNPFPRLLCRNGPELRGLLQGTGRGYAAPRQDSRSVSGESKKNQLI